MKTKTIKIGDYIVTIHVSRSRRNLNQIMCTSFMLYEKRWEDLTPTEILKGRELSNRIFNNEYKEYIDSNPFDLEE